MGVALGHGAALMSRGSAVSETEVDQGSSQIERCNVPALKAGKCSNRHSFLYQPWVPCLRPLELLFFPIILPHLVFSKEEQSDQNATIPV